MGSQWSTGPGAVHMIMTLEGQTYVNNIGIFREPQRPSFFLQDVVLQREAILLSYHATHASGLIALGLFKQHKDLDNGETL